MCLECRRGHHNDCEAKRGAIGPCNCPTCFPPHAAVQGDDEPDSDYADRLLNEHGIPTPSGTARRWEDVDTGGKV